MYQIKNKDQKEMTASPDKYPQGYFKEKECRKCKSLFKPNAPSHLYCSQECADFSLVSNYLKRNYGLDYTTYLTLLEEQQHKCKICDGEGFVIKDTHKIKLVVDHDHETGKVRGLLCHNCNRGLGLFKDNTKVLKNAINYLTET
jgi:hypothetical protein